MILYQRDVVHDEQGGGGGENKGTALLQNGAGPTPPKMEIVFSRRFDLCTKNCFVWSTEGGTHLHKTLKFLTFSNGAFTIVGGGGRV